MVQDKKMRSVFRWIEAQDVKEGITEHKAYTLTTSHEVAKNHGVPMDYLIRVLEAEVRQARAFSSMPFTVLLVFSFCYMVFEKDPVIPVVTVEGSIADDIVDNADFACTSDDQCHKDVNDVTDSGSFYDWMNDGFIGLLWSHDVDFSEGTDENDPAIIAAMGHTVRKDRGYVMDLNVLVGGVRIRQTESAERHCREMSLYDLTPFYEGLRWEGDPAGHSGQGEWKKKSCVGGLGNELAPDLPSAYQSMKDHVVDKERWLYIKDDAEVIEAIVKNMSDSDWWTPGTKQVEIAMPIFNADTGVQSLVTTNFYSSRGGFLHKKIIPMSTFSQWYYGPWSWVPDGIWFFCLLWTIITETRGIIHTIGLIGWKGFLNDKFTFWLGVDVLSIGFGGLIVLLFSARYIGTQGLNDMIITMGNMEDDDSDAYKEMVKKYVNALEVEVHALWNFRLLAGLYPLLIMFRFFKAFSAQPRMSIVSKTLSSSAMDLLHFFVVFVSVFMTYAVSGCICFGKSIDNFVTFPRAFVSSFRIMMGDFDFEELAEVGRAEAMLWFMSFQVIVVMLMLNMLLAIIMEAYGIQSALLRESESLWSETIRTFERFVGQQQGSLIRHKTVEHILLKNKDEFETVSLMSGKYVHEMKTETWSIVTIEKLQQLCENMRMDQARELLQKAVELFYQEHRTEADTMEALHVLHEVDSVNKQTKSVFLSPTFDWMKTSPTGGNLVIHEIDIAKDVLYKSRDRARRAKQAEESAEMVRANFKRQATGESAVNSRNDRMLKVAAMQEKMIENQQTMREAMAAVAELEGRLVKEQDVRNEVNAKFGRLKDKVNNLCRDNETLQDQLEQNSQPVQAILQSRDEYQAVFERMVEEHATLKAARMQGLDRATAMQQATKNAVDAVVMQGQVTTASGRPSRTPSEYGSQSQRPPSTERVGFARR